MSAPVLVVLNPASSSGRALRLRSRIESALCSQDVDFELRVTKGPGHATALAEEGAGSGVKTIVVVGGDGTVHEVVRGLLGTPPEGEGAREAPEEGELPQIVVVPVGTGNDFYRMVGTPRTPEEALRVLRTGRLRMFDLGVARWKGGGRYFVNLLGVGVDVEVIRRREGFRRLDGLAQYLTALLVALLRFEPYDVRIHLDDGEDIAGPCHLAAITVGPSAGGGFQLNPTAVPDDGRLDLCFVEALTYGQIARYLPRVVRGAHEGLDVVCLRRFRRARLERADGRPFEFELDGELQEEPVEWIEVGVAPGRLPVLTAPVDR